MLPGPADKGPYPTVVEYSGYDPSSPTTGQPQYKLLAPALGFAWVGVNMRGTGCSGGAYLFFENLQSLDGYDAIETVAAQPWSTGRVGMVGISFAGISQLFVARSQPPHLNAITPLSVIDDTWRGTLYPGGIYNDGFAKSWAQERLDQNKWPNPDAPGWVKARIAGGDTQCEEDMHLRGQNVDLQEQSQAHPFYSALDPKFRYDLPNGGDSLAPQAFVKDIKAPTFLAGAWQDEQTGGHWADMINRFSPDHEAPGRRSERRAHRVARPERAGRDGRVPRLLRGAEGPDDPAGGPRAAHPRSGRTITGVGGLTIPPDRFDPTSDFDTALATFESDPPVRINWEVGNVHDRDPGRPGPDHGDPLPGVADPGCHADDLVLPARRRTRNPARDGVLRHTEPDKYRGDPDARPKKSFAGGNIWAANPTYDWKPVVDGKLAGVHLEPAAEHGLDGRHRERRPLGRARASATRTCR